MNKNVIIGIVVAVLIVMGGFLLFSSSDSSENTNTSTETSTTTQNMSVIPADLDGAIAKAMARQGEENVYIIDVRTPEEWEIGHVKGAMLWGLEEKIALGQMPPIDKDAEIYVYCHSGNRAGQSIQIMQDAGFTNMTNIRSYDDWVAAGGSTEIGL